MGTLWVSVVPPDSASLYDHHRDPQQYHSTTGVDTHPGLDTTQTLDFAVLPSPPCQPLYSC